MQNMGSVSSHLTRIKRTRTLAGYRKYIKEGVSDLVDGCGAVATGTRSTIYIPPSHTDNVNHEAMTARVLGRTLYCCPKCKGYEGGCDDC